jgi:hypothetical protein
MMRSLEPFWKMAPTDVVRLMERSDSLPRADAWIYQEVLHCGGKD